MKSRAADFSACGAQLPVPTLVKVVDAWGFSAFWIDSDGYSTADGKHAILEAGAATRSEPIGDRSGRFKVSFLDSVSRLPQNARRELQRSLPKDGSALQVCAPIQRAVGEAGL